MILFSSWIIFITPLAATFCSVGICLLYMNFLQSWLTKSCHRCLCRVYKKIGFVLGWRCYCFRFYMNHIHVSRVLSASLRQLSVPFLQWQDCGSQHALQHEWLMQTTVLCYCLLCCLRQCCACCTFKALVMYCSVSCKNVWLTVSLSIFSHKSEILKTLLVALFHTLTMNGW